jgi:tRNA threonylcarbamoyl adenosine modification protein (Sua5/YciO/YrdC/YwlC family)
VTQRFELHPVNPQPRLLRQAAQVLKDGALLALPTDACYVLACRLGDRESVDRLRAIRGLDDKHLLTLMCRDLSELAVYARVDNRQYRFLKEWTPGPYTFVLNATKETPRRLWHPSRKTIGLRVPDSPVVLGLLEAHGEPVLCSSLIMPGEEEPLHEADEIVERLAKRVDLVLDVGGQPFVPTTVVDLTGEEPMVTRLGCGTIEGMTAQGG